MANLLEILKEQSAFGFTGKINLLLAANGQFQGVIYQHDGVVVGAHCGQLKDKKALYKMIFDDVDSAVAFKFVVEPEVVGSDLQSFKLSFEEVKKEAQDIYHRYQDSKKLRPPMHLKLVINPEIIVSLDPISPEEFDVLAVLAEWCTVSDVYKYSRLMDFDVTNALVSLRKKKAIKVFQN